MAKKYILVENDDENILVESEDEKKDDPNCLEMIGCLVVLIIIIAVIRMFI